MWGLTAYGPDPYATKRPVLDDGCSVQGLLSEIEWTQGNLVKVLDQEVRRVCICATSKRWWCEEIREKRRALARAERKRKRGEPDWRPTLRRAKEDLREAIRTAKRNKWTEFLEKATGDDVWAVMRYTRPPRSSIVPTITHEGITANSHEAKSEMLVSISFPPPVPYDGDEGEEGPTGSAHRLVNERVVCMAFSGTSTRKSPGPDSLSPLAVRCL